MVADRTKRHRRLAALGLLSLCVGASSWALSGGATAQVVGESQGETRALALSFDSTVFVAGESFTFALAWQGESTDTCRVEMQGGFDSGWVGCSTISSSHSFTYAGIRWAKMRLRDATMITRQVRIVTLSVGLSPSPSPTPTYLVEVVNKPRVEVANTPLPVKWRGCYEPDATCPTGSGGLGPEDAENIEMMHEDVRSMRWTGLVGVGLVLFALAGLLALAIRGLFR